MRGCMIVKATGMGKPSSPTEKKMVLFDKQILNAVTEEFLLMHIHDGLGLLDKNPSTIQC